MASSQFRSRRSRSGILHTHLGSDFLHVLGVCFVWHLRNFEERCFYPRRRIGGNFRYTRIETPHDDLV